MREDKLWARPEASSIPNRPGDREEEPLYAALGRAVSDWEGLSAVTAALHRALLLDEDRADFDSVAVEQFGGLNKVHQRAKKIKDLSAHFFEAGFGSEASDADDLRTELPLLLAAYCGWAERRNDLAHGYVTRADGPDYEHEDQPIIATYALCPSHGRIPKWSHGEPEYNYVVEEIGTFAAAFRDLDRKIEVVANRIDSLRSSRLNP